MEFLAQNRKKLSLIVTKRYKSYHRPNSRPPINTSMVRQNKDDEVQKLKIYHKHLQTSTNFTRILLQVKTQLKKQLSSEQKKNNDRNEQKSVDSHKTNNNSTALNEKLKVVHHWLQKQSPTIDVNLKDEQLEEVRKASKNILIKTNKNWKASILRKQNYNNAIINPNQKTLRRLQTKQYQSQRIYLLNHQQSPKNHHPGEKSVERYKTNWSVLDENLQRNVASLLRRTISHGEISPKVRRFKTEQNLECFNHHKRRSNGKTYSIQLLKGRNICSKHTLEKLRKSTCKDDSAWNFDPW